MFVLSLTFSQRNARVGNWAKTSKNVFQHTSYSISWQKYILFNQAEFMSIFLLEVLERVITSRKERLMSGKRFANI